jgi:dienelactone hydrolase
MVKHVHESQEKLQMKLILIAVVTVLAVPLVSDSVQAQDSATSRDTSRGDKMIAAYFKAQSEKNTSRSLSDIKTLDDWEKSKDVRRQQLFEMLGLDPFPNKTPLQPKITKTTTHEDFVVENIHFQSLPGLYVTGNFYRPKTVDKKLPTILYVCGHGRVKKDGVSYGNKVHYQHHGAWFARNGYTCLTIDTLQLGEIEGVHHGTYSHDRWWWNSRGYSSAGVEAWNCIRALDYLETRTEVDKDRFGVTGRSGGGAYSWWISALDERIKASVPVAGITSLKNHVVDGCVEGHCDCMFMVNTYGWDFAEVAALVAPRPLLISNTDKDRIFPLDGVVDVYNKTRRIYELHGQVKNIGLQICEGPHKDTQELRVHAFHWFNKFLKGEDPLIETTAVKFFEPEQLQVFKKLPADEINTRIDDSFTKLASVEPSKVKVDDAYSKQLQRRLLEKCFRGWPGEEKIAFSEVFEKDHDGVKLSSYDFSSQENVTLQLFYLRPAKANITDIKLAVLNVLDEDGWSEFLSTVRVGFKSQFANELVAKPNAENWQSMAKMLKANNWAMVYVCPRGIGPTAWDQSKRKQTQHRRRFMLLGQTLDGMRLWDIRRAIQAWRVIDDTNVAPIPLWIQAKGQMAGLSVYASIFDGGIKRLDLYDLPNSHRDGPTFLNVQRVTDIPDAVAFAAHKTKVVIYDNEPERWSRSAAILKGQKGELSKNLQIRKVPK